MADYAVKPDSTYTISLGGKSAKVNVKIMPSTYLATKYVASYVQKGQPLKACKKMYTGKPLGITVHNTGDITSLLSGISSAAEQYVLATYNCNMGGAIVHYYVSDGVIWQLLADDEQAWHSGTGTARVTGKRGTAIGGNTDTIAIECVGASAGAESTAALLVAYLCNKYGFDVDLDVYTHKEWSGKQCPVYILPHWATFVSNIKTLKGGSTTTTIPTTNTTIKVGDTVKVKSGAVYGGAVDSVRGKAVPAFVLANTYPVTKIQTNKNTLEALLGNGLNSWIAVDSLAKI